MAFRDTDAPIDGAVSMSGFLDILRNLQANCNRKFQRKGRKQYEHEKVSMDTGAEKLRHAK